MQKSLAELITLPTRALIAFVEDLDEPLLVTQDQEPQFVVQSLTCFERMVRRLRLLEAKQGMTVQPRGRNNIIHFPKVSI